MFPTQGVALGFSIVALWPLVSRRHVWNKKQPYGIGCRWFAE